MIGIKFITDTGDIVEAISEPYVITDEDNCDWPHIVVKDLKDNSVYFMDVPDLKKIPTDSELEKWNKS